MKSRGRQIREKPVVANRRRLVCRILAIVLPLLSGNSGMEEEVKEQAQVQPTLLYIFAPHYYQSKLGKVLDSA